MVSMTMQRIIPSPAFDFDWSRDARAQKADYDRSIESVLGPPPVDNRALGLSDESIQSFTDPQGISLSDGSAASQEKKKAHKK